jgi:probable HAF family extracellular repeat protein
MIKEAKNLGAVAGSVCLAFSIGAGLLGCGGHLAPVAGIGSDQGCGGVFSGGTLTIQYPARSRGPVISHNLSSALSAKVVITGAASSAGGESRDVTVNVNRDASQTGAHSEVYNLPDLATGIFPVRVTFYAGTDQSGEVVGSATASEKVTCSGPTVSSVSLTTVAKKVVVTPAALTLGAGPVQLLFSVFDASGTVVAVSAGSAIFSASGTAATVTPDGIATPVSVGTVQVSASVDGVTSPTVAIAISQASSTSYRVVDLGAGTMIRPGRTLNDNGLAVFISSATSQLTLVDVNTLATTPLGVTFANGGIDNSNLVVACQGVVSNYWQGPSYTIGSMPGGGSVLASGASGKAIGVSSDFKAIYWDSPTAAPTQLGSVGGDPTHFVQPLAINASKIICGMGFYTTDWSACYFPSPTAGQATLLPGLGAARSQALAINDSGVIAGFADTSNGAEQGVIWDTPSSTPRTLGTLGNTNGRPSVNAFGINNAGVVVGIDSNAPTANRAFVYTDAGGMKSLYDLCDSSRTGWSIKTATTINNKGWIMGWAIFGGVSHVYVAIPNP